MRNTGTSQRAEADSRCPHRLCSRCPASVERSFVSLEWLGSRARLWILVATAKEVAANAPLAERSAPRRPCVTPVSSRRHVISGLTCLCGSPGAVRILPRLVLSGQAETLSSAAPANAQSATCQQLKIYAPAKQQVGRQGWSRFISTEPPRCCDRIDTNARGTRLPETGPFVWIGLLETRDTRTLGK